MDRRRDDNRGGGRDFSRSNGGGYNRSSQSSSSSGHSPYDRGSSYRGDRGSSYRGGRGGGGGYGGRGGGRGGGGYGAPGGRAGADDSTTTGLPASEPELFSITELARLPPLPSKKSTEVRTNGYEIDTSKAIVAYQYDIKWTAETKKGKKFDMNKQTKDDVKFQLKQNALRSIFFTTIREFKEFFRSADGGDEKYSYDSGSMFFTQNKLLEDKEIRTFDLEVEKFEPFVYEYYRGLVKATAEITLTKVIRPDTLTGDLENDRPVVQYLELVLSQAQRQSGDYLSFNNKFYDKRSNEEIQGTPLVLKEGVTRSVRIIGEPSDKKLMVQMVPTKTTFYDGRSVLALIEHAIKGRIRDSLTGNQLKLAHDAVKSLCLRTTHLERNFLFPAAGLTKDPASRCTFEYKDKQTNVVEYFEEKYRVRLNYPELPCVIQKKGNDVSYHPVELLRIPDGQRVPKAKQDNDLNSKIIRQCQMLPAVNVEKIEKNREGAEILNSNMIIKKTGARVLQPGKLVTAPACQLLTPSIVLKDTQKSLNNGVFGMQTNDKFIHPATVRKVAFVLASNQLHPDTAQDFVKNFLRRLDLYGVRIDHHDFFDWRNPDQDYEKLSVYVKKDYDFAFIIGDTDSLHHGMKYMEINTKLPTQNVKTKTAQKPNNTLLDNLAFKFNLKAGGSNWAVKSDPSLVSQHQNRDLLKSLMSNTLFFGIDLSHPLGRADPNLKAEHADPSCVGFASNLYKGQANMSKGDFGYQCPQKTIVNATLLEEKFGAAINAYFRNSGCYPSWIVVYRAGLSEAEVKRIQDEEVPVLKATIAKLKSQCPEFNAVEVKLTVLMSNTNSNFRLFKDQINTYDKAPMQNVPSGTCVFEKIVSRRVPSFILVAQRALIGTARPAVFHILEGADAFPLDQIRYVTYALCFTHGIVTSPTKLPGPLVSAADLSKRARNNFRHQKFHGADDNQSVSSGDSARYRQGQGDILSEEEKKALDNIADAHYAQLNEALKATIDENRFWA